MVAILLVDNTEAERDIILHQRGGGLERISDTHSAYDSMHFPLLFPHGELCWHLAVRYQGDATSHNSNRVSCGLFAAFRLCIKANGYSSLHRAVRLFLREVSALNTEMRVHTLPGSPRTSRPVVTINLVPDVSQCRFEGIFQ